jgi:hypothetical protein
MGTSLKGSHTNGLISRKLLKDILKKIFKKKPIVYILSTKLLLELTWVLYENIFNTLI